jgi:hypothetical protein
MRAYLINEIDASGMEKIHAYLKNAAISSSLEKIFWLPIPEDLLDETQMEHLDCSPHVFAVELGRDWVKLECFLRSLTGMHCTCQGYCSEPQIHYIIRFALGMIDCLGIKT